MQVFTQMIGGLPSLQACGNLVQPLSARCTCMGILPCLIMGTLPLPNVLGWRDGTPRDQHLCQHCDLHVVQGERHLAIDCYAMQPVRGR